jgi:hypothetical protein
MPAMLDPKQVIHGLELGLEILEPLVVLVLDLLEIFVELSLRRIDLLIKQLDPLLQVAPDIAH